MLTFLVKTDDARWQGKVSALLRGLANAAPLMRLWGEIAHASITENFEVGGRPKWKRLSPVTIALKGHDRPLIGKTGNLAKIVVRPGATEVRLGTQPAARAYAAIQQYGGRAGRGLKILIPARPYMMLQAEDEREIEDVTRRYLKRLAV